MPRMKKQLAQPEQSFEQSLINDILAWWETQDDGLKIPPPFVLRAHRKTLNDLQYYRQQCEELQDQLRKQEVPAPGKHPGGRKSQAEHDLNALREQLKGFCEAVAPWLTTENACILPDEDEAEIAYWPIPQTAIKAIQILKLHEEKFITKE